MTDVEFNCQTLARWIEPYLDAQLEVSITAAFVQHLAGCSSCNRTIENEELLRRALKQGLLDKTKAPDGLWSRFSSLALGSLPRIDLAALAQAAAQYHRRIHGFFGIPGVRKDDVLGYYRSAAGFLPCDHHEAAMARAQARWLSASVVREAFPGRVLAWGTWERKGDWVSHVSVPRDYVGVLNAGILRFPFHTFTGSEPTVSVTDCITHVCSFVTENDEATGRVTAEVGYDFF